MRQILVLAIVFVLSGAYAHGGALEDGKLLAAEGEIDKAAQKYKMACDGRNMEACGLLGKLYADGNQGRIRQNLQRAVSLYNKGCKGNDTFSCTNLAELYAQGQGVRQNNKMALDLFNKSCNLKDETACEKAKTLLGFMNNNRPNDGILLKRNIYINRNGYTRSLSSGNTNDDTGQGGTAGGDNSTK